MSMIGQKFGLWTVLEECNFLKNKHKCCICKCECGYEKCIENTTLKTGRAKRCKSCAKKINLAGSIFGNWKVIKGSDKKRRWICQCLLCNRQQEVLGYHLRSGASTKCRTCAGHAPIDLTGQQIFSWSVLNRIVRNGQGFYRCQCKCGKISVLSGSALSSNNTKSCISCASWRGYKEISSCFFSSLKRSAEYRDIEFKIKIEDIWDLYLKQNKKCKLSGTDIRFARDMTADRDKQTVSVDRIDNGKGYTIDNIQLVHKIINFMKHTHTQEEFLVWCNRVAKIYPRDINVQDQPLNS